MLEEYISKFGHIIYAAKEKLFTLRGTVKKTLDLVEIPMG